MCFPWAHSLDDSATGASVAELYSTSRNSWSPPCGGFTHRPPGREAEGKGTPRMAGRWSAQSYFQFFLLWWRCDMEIGFSSWEGLMGFQNKNLLPSGTHAKPDRKHWEACTVDLPPEYLTPVFPLLLVRASTHWTALSHTKEETTENLQGPRDPPFTRQHGWFFSSTLQEWFLPVFGHLPQKMTIWVPVVVYSFGELKNSSRHFSWPLHLVHADVSLFLLS